MGPLPVCRHDEGAGEEGMSGGAACSCTKRDLEVIVYKANYSLFNGGRRTPSAYSEVACLNCERRWRTKAAYVDKAWARQTIPPERLT